MIKHFMIILFLSFISIQIFGQKDIDQKERIPTSKYTLSIPYLNLTNFSPDLALHNEIHFGYNLNSKDLLGIKLVSWKLVAPLGIPWGPSLANEDENYIGRLNEVGVGVYYRRFLRKRLYASVEAVPMRKKYLDADGEKLDNGFRLYTSFHVGYYVPLFKGRMFIQPQVHFNYWPINTEAPAGFVEQDRKWDNNFFLLEPNIYIGINF